jgi:hypothetical protein
MPEIPLPCSHKCHKVADTADRALLIEGTLFASNTIKKHGWHLVHYGHLSKGTGGMEHLKKTNSNRTSFAYAGGSA